ncbi:MULTISPECIES: glycosyltransferase [Pantoea]|uniref:Glycosyltransferase n=1 Tax=Candidatus Pantoea communis TaxID=2608354 RepID=A0ABX0RLB3_9GAMM|nr:MULTISPECIES: glycosyltransferase [Pantoea]NIG17884.1 glycosyltransferase [Pantoea communis]
MINLKTLILFFRYYMLSAFTFSRKITTIHTITFRVFSPEGGRGGGSAVQTCQQILMQDRLKDLNLKYTYFEENEFSKNWQSRLADLFGAIQFVILKTKDEKNCAYITHDYGTAFGLGLLRKKYVYISHLQGPRVEEKYNYGEIFTKTDEWIVKFCERFAFKKAFYVCFPSKGAQEYYFQSKYRSINKGQARVGPVLYNTIFANPEPESISNITKDDEFVTILSVGSLLPAKGLDLAPGYLEKKISNSEKKVRWILVGSGHLKDKIIEQARELEKKHEKFNFIFHENLTYPQIRFLNSICDIYLMPHRVSIFDLATLEAMKEGKMVILSPRGGNFDFNKDGNIIFTDNESINIFNEKTIKKFGDKNREVYQNYFSTTKFKENYCRIISDLTK